MKAFKKIAAVVATLALTVGMCTSTFAATWGSYFGMTDGLWYEGAEGKLKSQSETGWEAQLDTLGWGGCWGAQVFQEAGKVDIKKGNTYKIKCTLKSSNCDKLVLIKVAKGDDYAYGKWVQLKKGAAQTIEEEFTAKANADSIYFGLGGEFGDRDGVDADAEIRYSFAPGGKESLDDKDATLSTVITCSDFYLGAPEAENNDTNTGSDSTPKDNSSAVATGDFTPIACGAAAVLAAAVVVVFARKRKED